MGQLPVDADKMGLHHKPTKPNGRKAALRCRNAGGLCENPAVVRRFAIKTT
jgi:hypothetical protein